MSSDSSSGSESHDSAAEPINGRMDAIKYNVHTCFQDKPPGELKRLAHSIAIPAHLMLFNLDGNMNIAMSIRTAAVLGFSDVWVVGYRKYDARPEVGSKNYVNVHKVAGLGPSPQEFFLSRGLQPVLIEQGGSPLEEFNFKPYLPVTSISASVNPVCFIMGSESDGISRYLLEELSDAPRISISQYGLVRSLNVSIAASIVMYEYLRQWRLNRMAAII